MSDSNGEVRFTKRDQFEIEKVAGKPLGALYAVHGGQQYPTADYMLAANYVAEKKAGLTDLDYDEWLDATPGDVEVVEVETDPT